MTRTHVLTRDPDDPGRLTSPGGFVLTAVPAHTQGLLVRMFADPSLLAAAERVDLVEQLRHAVRDYPEVSDLRVLLGMALCVDLKPEPALDELGEAVRLDPDSFIAHLKLGELWMRLRVCEKAERHTHQAAVLARSPAQSQLARRQAATLRTMRREGIERGGYWSASGWLARLRRLRSRLRRRNEALAAVDIG
jgi:hypothetical protein